MVKVGLAFRCTGDSACLPMNMQPFEDTRYIRGISNMWSKYSSELQAHSTFRVRADCSQEPQILRKTNKLEMAKGSFSSSLQVHFQTSPGRGVEPDVGLSMFSQPGPRVGLASCD